MKQPKVRSFMETSEKYGNQWRRVAVVSCRECSKTESLPISMGTSLLNPLGIAKKFAQRDWEVGSNSKWDVCPECVALRNAKPKKPDLKLVENTEETEMKAVNMVTTLHTEPPRVMQRDDRRIIFEKLNEVYLDEKRGYDTGWSDHKVSTDLGVPRAWVEQVREEMFGPVGSNEDMVAFKQGVEELRAFKDKIEAVKATLAELNLLAMADKITKLEKLGDNIKKLIP